MLWEYTYFKILDYKFVDQVVANFVKTYTPDFNTFLKKEISSLRKSSEKL